MASDDDSTIYVDVAPQLSEAEADKAVSKLKDKFKRTKVPVEPDLDDAAADKTAGRLRDKLRGAGKSFGDSITDAFDHLDDAADKSTKKLSNRFKGLGDQLGKTMADELGHVFGTSEGGVGSSLEKLFKDKFGGIGDLFSSGHGSGDLLGDFDTLKGTLHDVTTSLRDLAPEGSKAARALEGLVAAIGPISAGALGGLELGKLSNDYLAQHPDTPGYGFIEKHLEQHGMHLPGSPRFDTDRNPSLGPNSPFKGWNPNDMTLGGGTGGAGGLSDALSSPGSGIGSAGTAGFTSGGGVHATLVDFTTPSISTPNDIPAAGAGVKNLFAVAESLAGTPYSQQLRNDCSGMVSQIAAAAVGLPAPSAGERFSTVNEGPWLMSHGFRSGIGGPNDLNIGWTPLPGNQGHTAATLPGGINAESGGSVGAFSLGGPTGAFSPQFSQHAFLPGGAIGGGGGGFGVSPAGFGGMGPLPPPTQSNTGQGGPISQQHLGQGSGAGISGGGLIGAAEQAGVAAAGLAGFGGGAVAAQVAEQEINLAVQKGTQLAYAAAGAPLETLWLQGGQMGAPSVQSPAFGWPGKLLSGLIGSQYSSPNTAGAVQPPKQPGQQDQQQDPANGNQSQGPTGSKDDPIHTKSADPKQGPPQGAATDAATMAANPIAMV